MIIPAGTESLTNRIQDGYGFEFTFSTDEQPSAVSSSKEYDSRLSNNAHYELLLYPNPAESSFNFRIGGSVINNSFRLRDMSGKVMGSWKNIPDSGLTIERKSLGAGIYLITFEDKNKSITKRVILK